MARCSPCVNMLKVAIVVVCLATTAISECTCCRNSSDTSLVLDGSDGATFIELVDCAVPPATGVVRIRADTFTGGATILISNVTNDGGPSSVTQVLVEGSGPASNLSILIRAMGASKPATVVVKDAVLVSSRLSVSAPQGLVDVQFTNTTFDSCNVTLTAIAHLRRFALSGNSVLRGNTSLAVRDVAQQDCVSFGAVTLRDSNVTVENVVRANACMETWNIKHVTTTYFRFVGVRFHREFVGVDVNVHIANVSFDPPIPRGYQIYVAENVAVKMEGALDRVSLTVFNSSMEMGLTTDQTTTPLLGQSNYSLRVLVSGGSLLGKFSFLNANNGLSEPPPKTDVTLHGWKALFPNTTDDGLNHRLESFGDFVQLSMVPSGLVTVVNATPRMLTEGLQAVSVEVRSSAFSDLTFGPLSAALAWPRVVFDRVLFTRCDFVLPFVDVVSLSRCSVVNSSFAVRDSPLGVFYFIDSMFLDSTLVLQRVSALRCFAASSSLFLRSSVILSEVVGEMGLDRDLKYCFDKPSNFHAPIYLKLVFFTGSTELRNSTLCASNVALTGPASGHDCGNGCDVSLSTSIAIEGPMLDSVLRIESSDILQFSVGVLSTAAMLPYRQPTKQRQNGGEIVLTNTTVRQLWVLNVVPGTVRVLVADAPCMYGNDLLLTTVALMNFSFLQVQPPQCWVKLWSATVLVGRDILTGFTAYYFATSNFLSQALIFDERRTNGQKLSLEMMLCVLDNASLVIEGVSDAGVHLESTKILNNSTVLLRNVPATQLTVNGAGSRIEESVIALHNSSSLTCLLLADTSVANSTILFQGVTTVGCRQSLRSYPGSRYFDVFVDAVAIYGAYSFRNVDFVLNETLMIIDQAKVKKYRNSESIKRVTNIAVTDTGSFNGFRLRILSSTLEGRIQFSPISKSSSWSQSSDLVLLASGNTSLKKSSIHLALPYCFRNSSAVSVSPLVAEALAPNNCWLDRLDDADIDQTEPIGFAETPLVFPQTAQTEGDEDEKVRTMVHHVRQCSVLDGDTDRQLKDHTLTSTNSLNPSATQQTASPSSTPSVTMLHQPPASRSLTPEELLEAKPSPTAYLSPTASIHDGVVEYASLTVSVVQETRFRSIYAVVEPPTAAEKREVAAAVATVSATAAGGMAAGGVTAVDSQLLLISVMALKDCSSSGGVREMGDKSSVAVTPWNVGSGKYAGAVGLAVILFAVLCLNGVLVLTARHIPRLKKDVPDPDATHLQNRLAHGRFPKVLLAAFSVAFQGLTFTLAQSLGSASAEPVAVLLFFGVCVVLPSGGVWYGIVQRQLIGQVNFARFSRNGPLRRAPPILRTFVLPSGYWDRHTAQFRMFSPIFAPARDCIATWQLLPMFPYGKTLAVVLVSSPAVVRSCTTRVWLLVAVHAAAALFVAAARPYRVKLNNVASAFTAVLSVATVIAIDQGQGSRAITLVTASSVASGVALVGSLAIAFKSRRWIKEEESVAATTGKDEDGGDGELGLLSVPLKADGDDAQQPPAVGGRKGRISTTESERAGMKKARSGSDMGREGSQSDGDEGNLNGDEDRPRPQTKQQQQPVKPQPAAYDEDVANHSMPSFRNDSSSTLDKGGSFADGRRGSNPINRSFAQHTPRTGESGPNGFSFSMKENFRSDLAGSSASSSPSPAAKRAPKHSQRQTPRSKKHSPEQALEGNQSFASLPSVSSARVPPQFKKKKRTTPRSEGQEEL